LWYNALTMLPTGSLDEMELHPGYRSAGVGGLGVGVYMPLNFTLLR